MVNDFHIHTHYSCDSEATMESYCIKAIENKLSHICFTDHVDFNPIDDGFGYYQADQFFCELSSVQQRYGDKVRILAGIEFSEPHLYCTELEKLLKYPYDYAIGSIHWVNDMFPGQTAKSMYSTEQFFELYWLEVLKTVECGGFDCLGHIDFPKRYYGKITYNQDILKEIFAAMKKNGILLEINTSSLRKGISTALPDINILELYKVCGLQYVTIGSDAHVAGDLGADNIYAQQLIRQTQLDEVVFMDHKAITGKREDAVYKRSL